MSEQRFKELETRIDQINDRVTGVEHNTAAILKVVGGATQLGRLAKVHGPRVFAAVMGYLIASGRIDQEFADLMRRIFIGV